MSQDTEKYLYFEVGLLKDSFTLEALWQDALRYHMTDQLAKLIAMRLAEYYELTSKGSTQSRAAMPAPIPPTGFTVNENKEDRETLLSGTLAVHPPMTSSSAAHPSVPHPFAHLPAKLPQNMKPPINTVNPTGAIHREGETSLTVSAEVDQNAEEAADYWSLL
jgi:hypothetical protein